MNEKELIAKVNEMCEQSLSPDAFEIWETVKANLEEARNLNDQTIT